MSDSSTCTQCMRGGGKKTKNNRRRHHSKKNIQKKKSHRHRRQRGGDWSSGKVVFDKDLLKNPVAGGATDFSRLQQNSRDLSWKGGKRKTVRRGGCPTCGHISGGSRRHYRGGNIAMNAIYATTSNPLGGAYDSLGAINGDAARILQHSPRDPLPFNQPIDNF